MERVFLSTVYSADPRLGLSGSFRVAWTKSVLASQPLGVVLAFHDKHKKWANLKINRRTCGPFHFNDQNGVLR